MLVHKGGQINNVQLITGLRIARWGGWERRSETFVKIQKKKKIFFFFFFLGGGGVRSGEGRVEGGVRVDGNGEVKLV